jgi:methionyl-tRNA formyltransferase
MEGEVGNDQQRQARVVLLSYSMGLVCQLEDAVVASGHRIVGVLTSRGTKRRRSLDYLKIVEHFGPHCEVFVSSRPANWAAMLAPLKPDVIMCLGLPWRIPQDVLDIPRLGTINGHPSLLPKYRGAGTNVFGWMFRNDEPEAGFTAHRIDGDFDTGPILVQERVPITDEDDFESLGAKIDQVAPHALQQALEAVVRGDPGTPQPRGDGYYVHWFEEDWQNIDWSQPARLIHNQVRSWIGYETYHGAVGQIDGRRIRVITTRLMDGTPNQTAEPGTVLARDDDAIVIQCGDAPLRIIRWKEEDAGISM